MKPFIIITGVAFLIASCSSPKDTQTNKQENNAEKEAKVSSWIASRNYVFRAQTVLPMSGRTRQLTSEYDLRVSKDTIAAYLPYFGRAYSAPLNPQDGGIRFTSTSFDYNTTDKNNGGWEISVKLNDGNGTEKLNLSVSKAGYASLQVTSTNRQPISFNGYIDARKPGN